MSVKWVFEDFWNGGTYTFEINPNEGGSPSVTKNIHAAQNTGPNRTGILQEGTSQISSIAFSGVVITQTQYEAMETWFDKRVLIKLTDDLGRTFYGVFSKWNPKRQRRASHQWYHTYDAEFQVVAYTNASGTRTFGRVS